MTTLGTHNLLDGKAPATDLAEVIFYTEAKGPYGAVGKTHAVYVCAKQRDLVIAVNRKLGWEFEEHYKPAHWGSRKVSPHRGTYYLVDHKAKVVLIDEHRINAAFEPFKRGEKLFRKLAWWVHTQNTLRIIRRYKKRGYTVHAGGDLNTPVGVSGYKGTLNEVGRKYDRLGSTEKLTKARRTPRLGSDHFGLKAEAG